MEKNLWMAKSETRPACRFFRAVVLDVAVFVPHRRRPSQPSVCLFGVPEGGALPGLR